MSEAPLLEMKGITKRFPGVLALDQVDFSVQPAEVHALVGENGAGKSTLMKILTTYLEPSEGTASVNGFSVKDQKGKVQRSVGYLPEHNPLYTELYVREYLLFNASKIH